jgi:transposase-like protein
MGATGKPSRSSGGAVRRVEAGSVRASTRRCIGSKRRRIAWPWCWVRKPEGLDVSAAERVFGIRHAPITRWLVRAGAHAQTLHERSFRNLVLPHLQWDELRTRLRSRTQVLWLWVAIDPLTKCIPVLLLGARTHRIASLLIHHVREQLAPGCLPIFTSDGLHAYFYALTAHFG